MIVKPTGFLTATEFRLEDDLTAIGSRFSHLHSLGRFTPSSTDFFGQTFERSRATVVLPEQHARLQDTAYGLFDDTLLQVHTGCRQLTDDDVAETIEHESGQTIGFAIDPAIIR